jgi:hypothetical protein
MVSAYDAYISGINLRHPGRVTTQVGSGPAYALLAQRSYLIEYKEAFALFDKKGTGAVPRETIGDLLRALGQNPTQAEVADIVASAPRDGEYVPAHCSHLTFFPCSRLQNVLKHIESTGRL